MYSYSQNCSLGHTSEDVTVEDTRLADLMCHRVEKLQSEMNETM